MTGDVATLNRQVRVSDMEILILSTFLSTLRFLFCRMAGGGNETTTTTTVDDPTTVLPSTTLQSDVLELDAGTWGVAVAITVLVVMSLCLVVLYAKARRRRAAARQERSSVTALSGGVPMGERCA